MIDESRFSGSGWVCVPENTLKWYASREAMQREAPDLSPELIDRLLAVAMEHAPRQKMEK